MGHEWMQVDKWQNWHRNTETPVKHLIWWVFKIKMIGLFIFFLHFSCLVLMERSIKELPYGDISEELLIPIHLVVSANQEPNSFNLVKQNRN